MRNASRVPKTSTCTEWSMTSSAGTSGLILLGSPPRSAIASRIAARSTTAGTPVKSCITTRAGVKAISSLGSALASQRASASMSSALDRAVPSLRSRFSSSTFREKGSRATSYFDCSASRRKIVCSRSPTFSVSRASKEFGCSGMVRVLSGIVGEQHEGFPAGRGHRAEVLVDGRDALRAQQAGERDERRVRQAGEGWRRAIASVSPIASAHQRTR